MCGITTTFRASNSFIMSCLAAKTVQQGGCIVGNYAMCALSNEVGYCPLAIRLNSNNFLPKFSSYVQFHYHMTIGW